MCKAFSGVIDKNGEVYWKMGMDSHEDIISHFKIKDDSGDKRTVKIARFEIAPANGDYLNPDEWRFKLDEEVRPGWLNGGYEKICWDAQKEWKQKLDKILVRKPIVHPFKIVPPKKITKEHLSLLKNWASVWASVGASVGASVWASVWASVRDSVGASVWASVRDSVGDSAGASVWDSVWAYSGSFFVLPRESWLYTENIKTTGYPFQPAADLWEMGLVPSFDGKIWRLHGGSDAKILWEGEITK
jgi:hypothetical protein